MMIMLTMSVIRTMVELHEYGVSCSKPLSYVIDTYIERCCDDTGFLKGGDSGKQELESSVKGTL